MTGNEAFDQVGSLLAEKGVEHVNDILAAAAAGEVSLALKADLVEVLGPQVADMALKQLEGEVSRQREEGAAEGKRQTEAIAKALGADEATAGEAVNALKEFVLSAESGYSDADRQALDAMLAAGGPQADMAIRDALGRYQQSAGYTQVPTLLTGDGPTASGFQPLSKADYVDQIGQTVEKYGEGSREVEALRKRRTLSIQRGY
jgi:hypothetical protein